MRKTKKYKKKRRKTQKGGFFRKMLNKPSKMTTNGSQSMLNKPSKMTTNKFNQARQLVSNKFNQASQTAYDQMKNNIESIFKTPYIQKIIEKIKGKNTEIENYIKSIKYNNIKSINSSLNLDPNMKQNQAILEFIQKNNALLIKILKSEKLKLDILASGNEAHIQQMMLTILFDHKLDVLNPTFIASLTTLLIKLNNNG